jgi:hypothetical protein
VLKEIEHSGGGETNRRQLQVTQARHHPIRGVSTKYFADPITALVGNITNKMSMVGISVPSMMWAAISWRARICAPHKNTCPHKEPRR